MFRGVKCKHVYAVEFSLALRKKIETSLVIKEFGEVLCIRCDSKNVVKDAIRHNKQGDIQRYLCKECSKRFSFNIGFEKMKHDPQGVTTAMQLYFSGESLRNTARSLRLIGVDVSHQTIHNWISKYVNLMEQYVESILKPQVSDTWRSDEIFVKIKGDMKYVYALMDDETRYWIAKQVADSKYTEDIRPLLAKGKELMGKKPKKFITDGAPNFHHAYMKEYWTRRKETRTQHIRHIRLSGDINNNKMERFNGELRDREKVMRSLKREDSPILTGMQLYHNCIREHGGLKKKAPIELCGIKIEGDNKWLTLIQNAARNKSSPESLHEQDSA